MAGASMSSFITVSAGEDSKDSWEVELRKKPSWVGGDCWAKILPYQFSILQPGKEISVLSVTYSNACFQSV